MVAKEAEGTVPLSAAINLQPGQGLFYSPSSTHSPFKAFPKLHQPKPPQVKKKDIGKMEPDVCGMGKKKDWEEEEVLGLRL